MKQPFPSMPAFQKQQAQHFTARAKRNDDIRQSVKAGVPLADLGRKYNITMERVRQIGKTPAKPGS